MNNEQKVQNQHVSQHNSNEMLPAVLRLTLKKKWFDMIAAGIVTGKQIGRAHV